MNLRDKLTVILPEILPADPLDAMKGTELIRLVKLRLKQEYSDASLRYHFSIMCCDPASPIAKVDQGQGYYLRTPAPGHAGNRGQLTTYQARLGLFFENEPEVLDQAVERQHKLRAILCRAAESENRFPFLFESSFGEQAPYENVWKCPDAVLLDWHGAAVETNEPFDPQVLESKRLFGLPPFSLTSVKLKLNVSFDSFREDFFQALSNARWSHAGELVIASPILDENLAEELRRLGHEYGLGIRTLGIAPETIDDLVPHYAIAELSDREFEKLVEQFSPQRLCSTIPNKPLNWSTIERYRQDNPDFANLFDWIGRSLRDHKAYAYRDYSKLVGKELLEGDA